MNSLAQPRKWERFFWPLLASAIFLALWHYAVVWTATKIFPSPLDVEKGLLKLAHGNVLWRDIADSLRRVAIGYGAAVILGIPLGLVLGWYPSINQVVNPAMQILRPISPIAWIPIAIIFFGVGDNAAIFLIFLSAFFPIVVACIDGVSNVPSMFRRAGRNFGLSPLQLLARVIFPAALPRILIGLRISLGIAWLVVVAAEMIAVDSVESRSKDRSGLGPLRGVVALEADHVRREHARALLEGAQLQHRLGVRRQQGGEIAEHLEVRRAEPRQDGDGPAERERQPGLGDRLVRHSSDEVTDPFTNRDAHQVESTRR